MTVSSIVPVNNYTGNSSTTIFDFDFLIEKESELVVQHINSLGIVSTLQIGVDYSISEIGSKNGAYITFPISGSKYSVLCPDEHISLSLDLEIKQESEFHNSSYFKLEVLEWTFDYVVRILQILNRKIERCIKVEETAEVTPEQLMADLYDTREEVQAYHLDVVKLSNSAKVNSDIAIEKSEVATEQVELAKQEVEKAKEQVKLATQKARDAASIPIGTIILLVGDSSYAPEGYLPCDGAEYTRAQFEDFCKNYLDADTPLLKTCTYTQYEEELSTNGQCSKFAVEGNTTVKTNFSHTTAAIDFNYASFAKAYKNGGADFTFTYNGTNWLLDGAVVDLSDYYITATGRATAGDYITVSYGLVTSFRVPFIKDTETVETNYIDFANGSTLSAIPTAEAPFTAPFDGVYISTMSYGNRDGYFYVNGIQTAILHYDEDNTTSFDNYIIPLSKGDVCYWDNTFTLKTGVFYPYKEETKEKLKSFVVVANGQVNQSMMDWSAWASSLQAKMNTDHSNDTQPYITETYVNGTSWYRVWSDGWCEQGGRLDSVAGDGTTTITFLKEFINSNYTALISSLGDKRSATQYANGVSIQTQDTSSMVIYTSDYTFGRNWYVCGYKA